MMSDDEKEFMAKAAWKIGQINDLMSRLLIQKQHLRAAGLEPSAVVLPVGLDPGKYEGDDATGAAATLMGLPVIFGSNVGLVVPA